MHTSRVAVPEWVTGTIAHLQDVRSAWVYFVFKLAGYRNVRNYPGSFWEWSRDFACPVEKDAKGLQQILKVDPQVRPS